MAWHLKNNQKFYINYWNPEKKLGFYAIYKMLNPCDENTHFGWKIRKYTDKPFGAIDIQNVIANREKVRKVLKELIKNSK